MQEPSTSIKKKPDRNVYEFDLTLWNLLSTLAKERRDDAASQFSLGMDTVQKLSLATPSQLEALASGVLISFNSKQQSRTSSRDSLATTTL